MKIRSLKLEDIEQFRPVHDCIFDEKFDKDEYLERLSGKRHLILAAEEDGEIIGFKVGYERDNGFYSWLGGVMEEHRRKGIASRLAEKQEEWAHDHGFSRVWFKTYNERKPMLIFALRRGFNIVKTEYGEKRKKDAIFLEKMV